MFPSAHRRSTPDWLKRARRRLRLCAIGAAVALFLSPATPAFGVGHAAGIGATAPQTPRPQPSVRSAPRPPSAPVQIGAIVTTRSFSCAGSLPQHARPGTHVQFRVRLGRYQATLSGTILASPPGIGPLSHPQLAITSGRRTQTYGLSGPDPATPFGLDVTRTAWRPGAAYHQTALCIAELGSSFEPTVVVPNYSGGAHCCTLLNLVGAGSGSSIAVDLGNPAAVLAPAGGRSILVTADNAFAYAFTDYAGSAMPIRVLQMASSGVAIATVTRHWLNLVRQDAGYWISQFEASIKRPPPYDERGLIAAWAADECELKECSAAFNFVRHVKEKYLSFTITSSSVPSYIRQLRSFLQSHGYG